MSTLDFASLTPAQQEAVLDGPSLEPPLGVDPNFDDPPNLNHIVYPVLILSLVLTTIFLLLRACGRWYAMKTVGTGDCMYPLTSSVLRYLLTMLVVAVLVVSAYVWRTRRSVPPNHALWR
jgi:hypothetical protein